MTFLRCKQTFASPAGVFTTGQVFPAAVEPDAASWMRAGLAEPTEEMPDDYQRVYEMLENGAGKNCLFPPFLGEFGHAVMFHVRFIHFHKASRKVVCCRRGEEVLYPSAAEFFTDWSDPVDDRFRCASMSGRWFDYGEVIDQFPSACVVRPPALTRQQELVAIYPEERIPFHPRIRGLRADVCLGVRRREFCPEKNWAHWQRVADALTARGISFATVGDLRTSYHLQGEVCHSGDYDTDAAVELIQHCRLFIGSDTGSAHLAATVGCNMVVFRETSPTNRDLRPRMQAVNPLEMTLLPASAWTSPQLVIDAALEILVM